MSHSTNRQLLSFEVPEQVSPQRLDTVLAGLLPEYSRSRLQQWIKTGFVLVDGECLRPKDKVSGREQIEISVEPVDENPGCQPQDISIDVVYEDEAILVINKPAGLVVHPAAGNKDGTLQNALLFYDADLSAIPRAGIVHRLDKDTSGIMVVARTLAAHKSLVDQLQERSVSREYEAVVNGVMVAGTTVDQPIARHSRDRKRMAVSEDGKQAVTHLRVIKRYRAHTHVLAKLETGRTHQIRVHLGFLNYPIVGDRVYGGRQRIPSMASETLKNALRSFPRQALHAKRLGLIHPVSGEFMQWENELPDVMHTLIQVLASDAVDTR